MNVKIEKMKLSEIKINPDNPRTINKDQMERLVKSLQDFPEMMQLREIVVDENMMILGGNMRYLALKEAGEQECIAKIVSGLTNEQKREFIIKDNVPFGEWDFTELANAWDDLPLVDWGIEDLEPLLGDEKEKLEQKEQELKPYTKVHVLISIDIDVMDSRIIDLLDELRTIKGIEIEQGAN